MTTRSTALVLLLLAAAGAASALDRERLDVRSVAANCAQCHGTGFKSVAGSGGLSAGPTELEGRYAMDWARNIWTDIVG